MSVHKYTTKSGSVLWYSSVRYEDWKGERKQTQKKGFKTRREAIEWETSFLDHGHKDSDVLFSTLVDEYLKDQSARLKPSTMATKTAIIEKKILPYFGKRKICDITPLAVRKWQTELIDAGDQKYSQTYLRTINAQFSSIMNYATKFYGLPKNPCHAAGTMGKSRADEMHIWTREQFEKMNSFEKKKAFHVAFDTLYYTGIREGELLALTPADIDPDKPVIHITKTFAIVKGKQYFLEPKTPSSKRDIEINSQLHKELLDYIGGMMLEPTDRIFYFTKSGLSAEFHKMTRLAGLEPIRIHDLRHSHASLLIHLGVPIVSISKRLGHESPDITLRIYSHLYPGTGREAADLIENMFAGDDGHDAL